MNVKINLIDKNLYKILIKPVNKGYSEILANLIRKLLFNLSEGFSITEIKFYNSLHEYDNIFGVNEDILTIISNFKDLIIKLKKKNLIINIKKKGPFILKGKDIENKNIKIINKNKILLNLSENSEIKIKLRIEKGQGFIPYASQNIYKKKKFNGILIDAYFCPIISIFYYIENYEYCDCIKFFIKTNGSINLKKNFKNIILKFLKNIFIFYFKKKHIFKKKIYNFFFKNIKSKFNNIVIYYFAIFFKKNLIKLNLNKKFINKIKLKKELIKKKIFINYIKIYES